MDDYVRRFLVVLLQFVITIAVMVVVEANAIGYLEWPWLPVLVAWVFVFLWSIATFLACAMDLWRWIYGK